MTILGYTSKQQTKQTLNMLQKIIMRLRDSSLLASYPSFIEKQILDERLGYYV